MKEQEKFTEIISENKPTLVDFYADWCAPCQIQLPILEELEKEMEGKINVVKINVENNSALAEKYSVASIPTLMLFKNGEKVWKAAGIQQKETLKNIIVDYL